MTVIKAEEQEPARVLRREFIDDEQLDRLFASSTDRGVELTGEGRLLPELF